MRLANMLVSIFSAVFMGVCSVSVFYMGVGALFLVAMILLTIFASKKIQENRDFEDLLYSMQNRSEY